MNTPVRVGETIEGSRTVRNRPYQVLKCSRRQEVTSLSAAYQLVVGRHRASGPAAAARPVEAGLGPARDGWPPTSALALLVKMAAVAIAATVVHTSFSRTALRRLRERERASVVLSLIHI